WPVATTISAAKRFKVSPDEFEHKIVLASAGKEIGTLYTGSSPTFSKVHVRNQEEDSVYAVKLSGHSLDATYRKWIDTNIFNQKDGDIEQVQLPKFTLLRKDEQLIVKGLDSKTEKMDDTAVQRLMQRISGLSFITVLGKENKPEYNQDKPKLTYTVKLSSGKSQTYVFSKADDKQDRDYVLKASHRDEYFKVGNWVVDDIMRYERSNLVKEKKNSGPADETDKSDSKKTSDKS
ncbi:MAG: DUF4340 domain-containing protein, partial [Desulfobacteraceae bacterium]